jgi:5-formyltetrahydrofolate cyclo-ligase
MPGKTELRALHRRLRRELPQEVRARESAATADACGRLLAERAAQELASYWSLPDELDLRDLHAAWWAAHRRVWLPRALPGGELRWHALTSPHGLRRGAFGIMEADPAHAPEAPLPPHAAIVVPGLAFAADGRRLGQGGGYYDRVLASHTGLSIGVGFACQRCDEIPHEPHDRAVRAVILGGEVLRS